jgi:hypothetical protein
VQWRIGLLRSTLFVEFGSSEAPTVSDVDPAEVRVRARSHMADEFNPEPDEPAAAPAPVKKPDREGLPPGYRMRADAHYVEHLTSRRERASAEPARHADPGDRAERLLAQLAEDLSTIETAAGALSADTGRMAKRVNADLIRSQVWRATWALKAHAIAGGTHRSRVRPRPLGYLLDQVRHGWAAEGRLVGLEIHVQTSDWNAVVAVDEASLIAGVNGAIIATLGLVGEIEDTTLTLTAVAAAGELRSIDVIQGEVLVSPGASGRFFDATWIDRPGGWLAGLGAATARAASQQHGGEAVFLTDEHHGSTVRMQLS